MSRKANPTLIGVFVLGALILGTIAILLLAGGEWFRERREHILYFEEAAQGLQVGAPVVFLGVKIGTVTNIQLGIDDESQRFVVPVTIELDPHIVHTQSGEQIDLQDRHTIRHLVEQGMRARLKMQNLLTGQLFVDLDFYPGKPAHFCSDDPEASEIPTLPTTIAELTSMLEDFPVAAFLDDLSSIGAAIRKILTSEAVDKIPVQLAATLAHLESLAARLDSQGGPLLGEAKAALGELRRAIAAVQKAMTKVGVAADGVGKLTDADSSIYSGVAKASADLAGAAQALRQLASEESPTVQRLNGALLEISRAARAIRLLAESLEQQPEAILRGKRDGGAR